MTMSETPGVDDGVVTAEGDSDQLPIEDTLLDRGVDDVLDEGYSPPEREPHHRASTPYEEATGERLDQRLAQEEPEVWDGARPARQDDRAGRLEVDVDAEGKPNDVFAIDAGVAGAGASAEESAMHVVSGDVPGTEDDDADETPDPVPDADDDIDLAERDEGA